MSIVVAFVLFGALMAIRAAFSMGVDVAGADRLMMIHKVSIIQSAAAKLRGADSGHRGRDATSPTRTGSAATTRSRATSSQSMAVDPETWLQMYPEFELPADQKKAWLADRTGAVVGADHGEAVRLEGRRPRSAASRRSTASPTGRRGNSPSTASTTRRSKGVDKTQFFFHYDYLNETCARHAASADQIGWYVFKVADPIDGRQLAKKIDAMFANSPTETKTATEKAFVSGWAKQVGDIGAIMIAIAAVGMFFILFVAGNTMAQSIRERTNELGVLKTLGFGDGRVLVAGAARVVRHRAARRRHRPGAGLADHRAGRSDRRHAADLPFPAARSDARASLRARCSAFAPACCRRFRRGGSRSSTRCRRTRDVVAALHVARST